MIGKVLDDRYAILRVIGQGGMGAVYEARHTGTNRRVAIKVILAQGMQDEQVARFQREARIVGAVESQHITMVYDTGRDRESGAPYIAMELLDGEDASVLIKRMGPLHTDLALRIAFQACLGLDRAHRAGIVHRDIKSANIFLARQDLGARVVKLLDFGIAKATETGDLGDGGLTKTGAMLGSPLYMSPEQARGGAVDARADLWSLGVTLYEMLSGVRPNEGVQQLGELVLTICMEPARWIQDVAPWVPSEVAQVVHRALTIDKNARFQSAEAFAAALRPFLPHGHAIDDSMLMPLSQTLRNQVAPRGTPLDPSGVHAASGLRSPHEQSGSVGASAFGLQGASTGGVAPAPARASSSRGLVVGAVIAAAIVLPLAAVLGKRLVAPSDPGPPATAIAAPIPSAAPPAASAILVPVVAPVVAPEASVVPSAIPSSATTGRAPVPAKTAKPAVPPIKKQDDETSRK